MIYQLHIVLKESNPPIWRRIQVSGRVTLYRLNLLIQRAMGWENMHLSEFKINEKTYADTNYDEYGEGFLEYKDYRVSKSLPGEGGKFLYTYDFGDDWCHEVTVEKIFKEEEGVKYPRCIDGERACPPEDVGGISGYEEYLEAIVDPDHDDHETFMNWRGPYESEEFDEDEATKRMQKR